MSSRNVDRVSCLYRQMQYPFSLLSSFICILFAHHHLGAPCSWLHPDSVMVGRFTDVNSSSGLSVFICLSVIDLFRSHPLSFFAFITFI